MRVTYIARSFLDYRVPVFEALSKLTEENFTVIFSGKSIPERVQKRLREAIGENAVGMAGERAMGANGNISSDFANSSLRIPWQPGILKKIKKSKPDVLVGDGFGQWTLPALVYRVVKQVPLVICYERTAHTERNAQWYRQAFRKTVLYFVDAMCVNGSLSKKYTQSLGMPASRITTGHMSADVEVLTKRRRKVGADQCLALRKALRIPLDAVVFISVSRLTKRKGLAEFLQSWKHWKDTDDIEIHLLIVGGGPERQHLEALCRKYFLTNVTFSGGIDYNDIHKYYAVADVFVSSTLEDNWSLVVPEAMACGLPVMCSQYNGCWPELVTERNGWVFDPMNAADTIWVLMEIIKRRDHLRTMGERSKEIVSAYSPKKAAEAIVSACQIALV